MDLRGRLPPFWINWKLLGLKFVKQSYSPPRPSRINTPSISCSIDHKTLLLLIRNPSRPIMAKPRTSQHSIGRVACPQPKSGRSERIALSEAPQTFALQEASLSIQAPKQGTSVSPLAMTERRAGCSPSSDCHTYSSRKRTNTEGEPGMETSSELSSAISMQPWAITFRPLVLPCSRSPICSEGPLVLIPWRGPSPEEYRIVYDQSRRAKLFTAAQSLLAISSLGV